MAAILSCAEAILPLVRCGAVYEEVYLNIKSDEPRAPTDDLRAALVGAYAKALELLARAIRDMRQSTLQQLWVALLHSGESEDPIKPLNNAETQLEKYVQACERHQRHLDNDQSQKLLYGLGKPLRHMNVNVEALLEGMQLEKRRRMLDNLSSIKFGDQHNSRKSARAEGTGEWIFKRQEFKLWENLSCSSIFWLTGQSMISNLCHHENTMLTASSGGWQVRPDVQGSRSLLHRGLPDLRTNRRRVRVFLLQKNGPRSV